MKVVEPRHGPFRWSLTVQATDRQAALREVVAPVLANLPQQDPVQLWVEDVQPGDDAQLALLRLVPYRELLQLRRRLPAEPSGLVTRSFRPEDADAFLAVNKRAFAWHPEQSGLTLDELYERMQEGWFDADGFRLHERDGHLAAFCWTKVHREVEPALGEIYVIAVDPAFHGQGLGGPMTLAGLEHLSALGLTEALLYVEADNAAARQVYDRLGFSHHSTNRAYRQKAKVSR